MSKKHLSTIGQKDTWITPKYITDVLGDFDLDPCEHTDMPWRHATNGFTIKDNGLVKDWFGRVWLNPPFNQYFLPSWMEKMSIHKNGLMLVSFAGETKRFHDHVWGKANGVLVLDHRPHFMHPDGTRGKLNSGQTMCLIAYDEMNYEILENCGLGILLKPV